MSGRFTVRFYNEDAMKEYRKLDGSTRKLVNVGLKKLEARADEIGKPLAGPLQGCKELKYRKDGIRVVFRIAGDVIEIVDVIAIGNRADGEVFRSAEKRLRAGGE